MIKMETLNWPSAIFLTVATVTIGLVMIAWLSNRKTPR